MSQTRLGRLAIVLLIAAFAFLFFIAAQIWYWAMVALLVFFVGGFALSILFVAGFWIWFGGDGA